MKLIDSLISFKKTFGRQGNDFGSFQINDTKFSNSNNLEDMYNIMLFNEPIVIGGEFNMDIYPQNELAEAQRGWYTILSKDNQWIPDDAKWNKNWIVFATREEDAIYYNEIDGGVYGSIEKEIFYGNIEYCYGRTGNPPKHRKCSTYLCRNRSQTPFGRSNGISN